jgi:predicted phosphodiesterase
MMKKSFKQIFQDLYRELELFQDYESLTRQYFEKKPDSRVLIVGHTHNPALRIFSDGTTFINTGTWTRMVNLDLGQWNYGSVLTYAKILVKNTEYEIDDFDKNVEVDLKYWLGINNLPYSEYH